MNLNTPFFSSKNILVITASTFAIYTLICFGVLIKNQINQARALQATKAQEARINNLSKEEKAILKAQNRFEETVNLVETSERIFLSYLQRKFDLPAKLGTDGPIIDLYEDPNTYPDQVHYLARIAYPERIVKELPKYELDEDIKITNIYSANCDHIPLPDNFWPTMERSVTAGGYYTTHVALAFSMMKDNGCSLPPGAADMKQKVTQDMLKLADNPSTLADLRYEAIAFLLLDDQHDLVKSKWIEQIVAEQRKDGGWSRETGEKKDNPHSTLLALWSLLEFSRPNTPDQPLIRHH